ncbi:hypothetical protein VTN02DRAFT_1679 [Thermoascus thermophilus]
MYIRLTPMRSIHTHRKVPDLKHLRGRSHDLITERFAPLCLRPVDQAREPHTQVDSGQQGALEKSMLSDNAPLLNARETSLSFISTLRR